MSIQTIDQVKQEQCWQQIKSVLQGHGYNLEPAVTISTKGMSFAINLVPAAAIVKDFPRKSWDDREGGGTNG
jgi:hypothetical protein